MLYPTLQHSKQAQMLIFEDCDNSFPLLPTTTSRERGKGKGKGNGWCFHPFPQCTYFSQLYMYVRILIIFVAGYILRLRRGRPLILQTQLTIDETGRPPPPISTPSRPSISTPAGRDRPPAPTPLDFDTGGRDLPPAPSCPFISTLVGGISLLHPPAPRFQCWWGGISLLHPHAPRFQRQWEGISLLHPRTSTATSKTRPHGVLYPYNPSKPLPWVQVCQPHLRQD